MVSRVLQKMRGVSGAPRVAVDIVRSKSFECRGFGVLVCAFELLSSVCLCACRLALRMGGFAVYAKAN